MAMPRKLTTIICKSCGKEFTARTKRQFCFECHQMRVVKNNSKPTLCWSCKKATGGSDCPWANEFKPVEGWNATPERLNVTSQSKNRPAKYTDSFQVHACPLFIRG